MMRENAYKNQIIRSVVRPDGLWFLASDVARSVGCCDPAMTVSRVICHHTEYFRECHELIEIVTTEKSCKETILNDIGVITFCDLSRRPEATKLRAFLLKVIMEHRRMEGTHHHSNGSLLVVSGEETLEQAFQTVVKQNEELRRQNEELERQVLRLPPADILSPSQQLEVSRAVKRRVLQLTNEGYAANHQMLYNALYQRFQVASYRDLQKGQLLHAKEFIALWRPATGRLPVYEPDSRYAQ